MELLIEIAYGPEKVESEVWPLYKWEQTPNKSRGLRPLMVLSEWGVTEVNKVKPRADRGSSGERRETILEDTLGY